MRIRAVALWVGSDRTSRSQCDVDRDDMYLILRLCSNSGTTKLQAAEFQPGRFELWVSFSRGPSRLTLLAIGPTRLGNTGFRAKAEPHWLKARMDARRVKPRAIPNETCLA